MKIYLAGPMSGIKKFNFPYFDKVAEELRGVGFEVVSPAELDSLEYRERVLTANGHETDMPLTWGDCLARDVRLIADGGLDGIVLLPNWHESRGAKLEAFVGVLCSLKFGVYDPSKIGAINPVTHSFVIDQIREWTT